MTARRTVTAESWVHRRSVRRVALAAALGGPVVIVPLLMTGYSSASTTERAPQAAARIVTAAPRVTAPTTIVSSIAAAPTGAPAKCINGGTVKVDAIDTQTGTATVTLTPAGSGCQTITLAAYVTPPEDSTGHATYPQYLVQYTTVELYSPVDPTTGVGPALTATIALPGAPTACDSQLDVVYGENQDGTPTVQDTLPGPYYADNGILLDFRDFVPEICLAPTTSSTPPTTPTSAPPTSSTPTSPTSTPPVTTSSTSVLPTSSSRPPTSTSSSTTSTPPVVTSSTDVLPTIISRAPTSPINSNPVLPYTGSNLPVRAGVMSAFALVSLGGALILFAGRSRRRPGTHR